MVVNEVLQWVVLSFCAVFLFGLTRQLGSFLLPRRELLATHGPSIGKPLSEELLPSVQRESLLVLLKERSASLAAYVVVYDKCAGCEDLLRELRDPMRTLVPVVALAAGTDPEFLSSVRGSVDIVVPDPRGELRQRADIIATPFVILLDENLKVVAKEVSSDLASVLDTQSRNGVAVAVHDELTLVER